MEVFFLLVCLGLVFAGLNHDVFVVKEYASRKKFVVLGKKYRPHYHIHARDGWLNDPSGFTYFDHRYHIFYQYFPYDGAWGPLHWGHVVSNNLVDWKHQKVALIPREQYELHGCLAGTATVYNSYLTLFYTGHTISNNRTRESQNIAISSDGNTFQKYLYNPVIKQRSNTSGVLRNPQVWRHQNRWYMILGTMSENGHGRIELYSSSDMFKWNFVIVLAESLGDMGFMWENPDFFEMNGQHVLILSVQGIHPEGYRFRNLCQTGYVVGNFNYKELRFLDMEISTATFIELDHGYDFYGAKTMLAPDGRRLLVAWLGMWKNDFDELRDSWASMLTLVRELKMDAQGKLLMTPISEIQELRTEILEDAWYSPGEAFLADAKTFELIVNSSDILSDAVLNFEWSGDTQITITYSVDHGYISLYRKGPDGVRRADWWPANHIHWRIFVDASSIELFCGDGEVVFTSRIYPKRNILVSVGGNAPLRITQYKLRGSVFRKKTKKCKK